MKKFKNRKGRLASKQSEFGLRIFANLNLKNEFLKTPRQSRISFNELHSTPFKTLTNGYRSTYLKEMKAITFNGSCSRFLKRRFKSLKRPLRRV